MLVVPRKIKNTIEIIKLTCTFSAGDATTPIFATISGLSEDKLHVGDEELNNKKGICAMQVRDLSTRSTPKILNDKIRYIIFCRLLKINCTQVR